MAKALPRPLLPKVPSPGPQASAARTAGICKPCSGSRTTVTHIMQFWYVLRLLSLSFPLSFANFERQGTTRNAVTASGLNWRLKFDEQDTGRLYACYGEVCSRRSYSMTVANIYFDKMKRAHPHLKQFRNDWACRELVLGCLQNRRKSEHAKIKGLMTNKATDRQPSKRKGFKPRPRSKTTDPEPESGSDQNSENGEE